MIIKARISPRASRKKIVEDSGVYKIYVTAAPVDGEANDQAIELVAELFNIGKSKVKIKRGLKSRDKEFEIIT